VVILTLIWYTVMDENYKQKGQRGVLLKPLIQKTILILPAQNITTITTLKDGALLKKELLHILVPQ
jgi:hypothetical protein